MAGDRAILYVAEPDGPVRTGPEGGGTVIRAVPTEDAAVETAVALVEGGVETIELCGATGFPWAARVGAAVRGRARVGTVAFGFESLIDAARFKERATAGEALTTLFLYLQEGADPAADRLERPDGSSRALFVAVPDPAAGAAVAAELAAEVQLIEVYGGFGPAGTAAVIEAVGGRVPVGAAVHSEPAPTAVPAGR
ncbi:DUF6506 family protein [Streptomyces sp. NPDC001985]|uniref:DUF6506 family protein n=1 Tax=Streptomyces sp. NPDC001985 TaxID=3154406 RepID=UPI00331C2043